jgi:xanthine dehydrogenase large subunit
LLEGRPNGEETIYRSKAVGEPPLMLAISTFLAIRDAIASCAPPGPGVVPDLVAPATPEAVLRSLASVLSDAGTRATGADARAEADV